MSVGHKTIPDGVTIDDARYEPMVIQRNGVPHWTGRWLMLVRPTPIAWSLHFHFTGVQLGALALLVSGHELPKQLR